MTMGAGLRPGTKAPESPPDPNVGAPAPDSTSSSCSEIIFSQLEHSVRHRRGSHGDECEAGKHLREQGVEPKRRLKR